MNTIAISSDDEISWNQATVTLQQLKELLSQSAEMAEEPQLQFRPDPSASYEQSAEVLMAIKEAGVTKFGFLGNEKYRVTREND